MILQPRFDATELLRLIESRRVTHIHMVPVMFHRVCLPEDGRKSHDVSSLLFVVHAPRRALLRSKRSMIEWWGLVIHEYYGGTETGIVTSCTPEQWLEHPGTVGRPVTEAVVRVIDSKGRDRPAGVPGEIVCRISGMADFTYHADPEKRREVDHNGLIGLDDVGYFDPGGFLYLCDRSRDMVISGGVDIYPAEIEAELVCMPGVEDCAVFGIPDAEFGEAVCAVIRPRETAALAAEQVRDFLTRRLASYKLPRCIEFRNELPREDSGKIFKRKLREPYWENAGRRI